MRVLHAALIAVAMVVGAAGEAAAAYPERPVRIVVVVPPGTAADIMARTIADKLAERLKKPFVVENRPGASSLIGSESVAKAPPDGYSLLLLNSAQTGAAALDAKFPLDLERDFAPVGMLGRSPFILAVSNDFPPKTLGEFIALAKARPGKINYGSGGYGSPSHLGMELLAIRAGIQLTHVPYKGQAAYNPALATNEIQIALGTVPGFVPIVSTGRVRPLAAGGLSAPKEYPDIPTVAASGFPGFDLDIWLSLVTTAGSPPEAVKTLNDALRAVLTDPATVAELEKKGFVTDPSTPEALGAFIKADLKNWREVVQRANLSSAASGK
jgi:tripartite-type tricarboxylate transporter receptor subunit TctC